MKKIVIIDFDNEMIQYDLPDQKGKEFSKNLRKLDIINSLGPLADTDYMDLCTCAILGVDFINNKITIYKATSSPVKDAAFLQEKRSIASRELDKHYEEFLALSLDSSMM